MIPSERIKELYADSKTIQQQEVEPAVWAHIKAIVDYLDEKYREKQNSDDHKWKKIDKWTEECSVCELIRYT